MSFTAACTWAASGSDISPETRTHLTVHTYIHSYVPQNPVATTPPNGAKKKGSSVDLAGPSRSSHPNPPPAANGVEQTTCDPSPVPLVLPLTPLSISLFPSPSLPISHHRTPPAPLLSIPLYFLPPTHTISLAVPRTISSLLSPIQSLLLHVCIHLFSLCTCI